MKNGIRIVIIVSILVGGTTLFGYYSLNQINSSLDTLSASLATVASTPIMSLSNRDQQVAEISTTTPDNISTSTLESVSTTTPISTSTLAVPAELKLSLVLPKDDRVFYIGCTYRLSLLSSTTITFLNTALIDAGTREASGPIASGLAKEYKIQPDAQFLDWKVGAVWPGEYFISLSNINSSDKGTQSKYFMIREISDSISAGERESICNESSGLL